MQANWIGRSEGVEMGFFRFREWLSFTDLYDAPDTLMGVTYLAVDC